jgi:hypothetical protein
VEIAEAVAHIDHLSSTEEKGSAKGENVEKKPTFRLAFPYSFPRHEGCTIPEEYLDGLMIAMFLLG